jgi:hypothetical protein
MPSVTIKLKRPFLYHDANVTELTIREPNGREVLSIGEPFEVVRTGSGDFVPVDVPKSVMAYAEACVQHEAGKGVLGLIGVEDARQVRDAIYGFFFPDPGTSSASGSGSSSST